MSYIFTILELLISNDLQLGIACGQLFFNHTIFLSKDKFLSDLTFDVIFFRIFVLIPFVSIPIILSLVRPSSNKSTYLEVLPL